MRVGVFGTGSVGQTIGTKLAALGHQVMMGSRALDNPDAADWASSVGERASTGTFAEAGRHGELLVNCTAGTASVAVLASVDGGDLEGKVLLDLANPLDHSQGFPPRLSVCNDDSLAEQLQRAHPNLRVVKSLNTMTAAVMVEPSRVPGAHVVFVSGNDPPAKAEVTALLHSFGWPASSVVDLGDITTARGTEMFLPLWVRLYGSLGTGDFNIAIAR